MLVFGEGMWCCIPLLLLMEEILHNLGCIPNLVNHGIKYQPQLVNAGFPNHQRYVLFHSLDICFFQWFNIALSSHCEPGLKGTSSTGKPFWSPWGCRSFFRCQNNFENIIWCTVPGWWFQIFFIFTPKVGENILFDKHIFQTWLKPPTRYLLSIPNESHLRLFNTPLSCLIHIFAFGNPWAGPWFC